jgi:hypothetical protein
MLTGNNGLFPDCRPLLREPKACVPEGALGREDDGIP